MSSEHMPGLRSMVRLVEPEWLDELPADDARARISRRDLCRINACMRNANTLAGILRTVDARVQTRRLVEIGAGDGEFLLNVARRLSLHPGVGPASRDAVLVDRQSLLRQDTAAHFAQLHWNVQAIECDVQNYLEPGVKRAGTMIANLFLHHFNTDQLRHLLRSACRQVSLFIAIEPRRSRLGWFFARQLRLIGCNAVTRHDAPISVRAGFLNFELSQLWPDSAEWTLTERRSGLFSHLFVAQKKY